MPDVEFVTASPAERLVVDGVERLGELGAAGQTKKDQPPPYLRRVWATAMSLSLPFGNGMTAVRLDGSMVPFALKRETRTDGNSSRKRR
jgi:hypothetical protein